MSQNPHVHTLNMSTDSTVLNSVPDEMWLKLLLQLDPFSITQFGAISRRFNAITKDPSLWEKLEIDVANINANLPSVRAIIDVASKLKQLKISNKKEVKVDDAVVASLILKAKNILKVLTVSVDIKLKNKAIVKFGNLSELESLELRSDAITATGLNAIGKLKNLVKLDIPGGDCYDQSYSNRHSLQEELNNLFTDRPNLHRLNLSSWCLTDENLGNLVENCFNLKHLNLARSVVYSEDGLDQLSAVAQLRNLQYLNLSSTSLSNESLKNIASNCAKLLHLNISNCLGVRDDGLIALSENCLKLRHLNLMGCKRLSSVGFDAIFRFKKLRHLNVSSNYINLTDENLRNISINCTELRYLDLSGSLSISDDGVKALAKNCPNLEHLNLSCCYRLKEEGIKTLVECCRELQYLNLSDLTEANPVDCLNAAASLKKLKNLDLSDNRTNSSSVVSSDSLKALTKNCPQLQHLNLKGFQDWTSEHFNAICSFKELVYLDVTGHTTSESVLRDIAKNCPQLRDLKVTIPLSRPLGVKKRLRKQLLDSFKKKHPHLVIDIQH